MALNQSIIFKENTQSNVQPRKPTFEQYIVYGIPLRGSQDNTCILTYISVYTFIYKQECNVLQFLGIAWMFQIKLKWNLIFLD